MNIHRFPTGSSAALRRRLADDPETLLAALGWENPQLSALARRAAEPPAPQLERSVVVEALVRHNEALGHEAGARAARALADPAASVILSGQQPGLLGGSLLSAVKAAGALLAARRIEAESGHPCVPIFWVASEDHDLDEANRLFVRRKGSVELLRAPLEGDGRALAFLPCDDGFRSFVDELLAELGLEAETTLRPEDGEDFARWSTRCLRRILGEDQPLVFAEPRVLWPLMGSFFGSVVEGIEAWGTSIRSGAELMGKEGLPLQVWVDEPSPFFLLDAAGRRERVSYEGAGRWSIGREARSIESQELVALFQSSPERISANVLLRPVALQAALPIIAHLCGPGELSYFGQLGPVFRGLGLPVPTLIPRCELSLIDGPAGRLASAVGLDPQALIRGPDAWPEVEFRELGLLLRDLEQDFDRALAPLELYCSASRDLDSLVPGLRKRWEGGLGKARKSLEKQALRARGISSSWRHDLSELLFPRGRGQDRVFSGPALVGPSLDSLREALRACDPFEGEHVVVELDDD